MGCIRGSTPQMGVLIWALSVYCLFVVSSAKVIQPKKGLETSPLTVVHGLESGKVILPCDVSPPVTSDDTILVLFYRGSFGTPIYSIDGRNGEFQTAEHWSDERAFGSRAFLDMTLRPPGLVINRLLESDKDEYRCRVDYRESPTRNVRVELNVIVPPTRMRIVTQADVDVSGVIGPYAVGSTLSLECRVEGGHPRPEVTWWDEAKRIDNTTDDQRGEMTLNKLTMTPLTRNDLNRVLTCQASNSNLSAPLLASVTLDLSFPPLNAKIHKDPEDAFQEGIKSKLMCETSGSRPAAQITWWKNEFKISDDRYENSKKGNTTRSVIHITPTLDDDTAIISCRAENDLMPADVMEDTTKLVVHYSPRLSLAPGQNLVMDGIKEGDDVYFECGIRANPKVYKVQWYHNGDELTHNVSIGVIQSNQSLVLQRVTRFSSGHYTCSASNLQGSGNSNSVPLKVKFAPLCREGQKVLYGAGKHEEINVTCSVEAHPEPISYRWAFNSSSEVTDLAPERVWVVGKGVSQVTYKPSTHLDYGSLLCWATNEVATQKNPCIYHIIHASVPDPVNNCTVENVSSNGVGVKCQAGWDGGLSQTFTLSVSHARAHTRGHDKKEGAPRVLANTSTSPKPQFFLTGLQPGTEYVLTILGVNKKGQSEAVRLAIVTLKDTAERRTSPGVGALALKPILAVVLGVVASLLLMGVIIIVVIRSRRIRVQRSEVKMVYEKASGSQSPLRGTEETTESEDVNPDIIPINDDHQVKEVSHTADITAAGQEVVDLKGHPSSQQPQQGPLKDQQQQLAPNDPLLLDPHHDLHHHDLHHDLHHQQQLQPKEYTLHEEPNYYMNPQSFLRQKPQPPPLDEESLRMGSHPLQHSPNTLRSARPTTYPHDFSSSHALSSYFQGMSSTPTSPSITANPNHNNRNSMHNPYPYDMSSIHATLAYQRRLSMFLPSYSQDPSASTATLPRAYPRELPSSSSYGQGFAAAPSYAQHRLSLNRNDHPMLMERVPSASSLALRGSSSTVAVDPDGDSPRTSVVAPRPLSEDVSSNQRESSV